MLETDNSVEEIDIAEEISAEIYDNSMRFRKWFIEYICNKFSINEGQLNSSNRHLEIIKARKLTCYFLWLYTTFSLIEIGESVGLKDHSSVLNHVNSFQNHCDYHASAQEMKDKIIQDCLKAVKKGRIGELTTLPNRG